MSYTMLGHLNNDSYFCHSCRSFLVQSHKLDSWVVVYPTKHLLIEYNGLNSICWCYNFQ